MHVVSRFEDADRGLVRGKLQSRTHLDGKSDPHDIAPGGAVLRVRFSVERGSLTCVGCLAAALGRVVSKVGWTPSSLAAVT